MPPRQTKTFRAYRHYNSKLFILVEKVFFVNTKNPKQTLNTDRGVGIWQLEKMVFMQMASPQGWEATHRETYVCPASRRFHTWRCGPAWAWVVLCVHGTQRTFIKAPNTLPGGVLLKS